MITLMLNGEAREFEKSLSIHELMLKLQLQPNLYLVELNEVALFRSEWESQKIKENDRIEIIRIVAGG